ncbi:hypothetical protein Tco_1080704 [Tanacetum coccineum]|uniref:Uncharacterized protein n=1 Tax=Tanacetum coccineum TaxID=301880 RepID=A0ABQ5HWQ9_9ASTR
MQGLRQDVRSLCGLVERSMTDQGRFSTWMISCMTQLMDASGQTYQVTKTGSKFSTIVREYVTEPSTLSKSRAELRREGVYKSVKAKEKTSLKEKKSTMLVENLRSGNFEVLES